MRRTALLALAVALFAAAKADAQSVIRLSSPARTAPVSTVYNSFYAPSVAGYYAPPYGGFNYSIVATYPGYNRTPPYSYYAAFPQPARQYVPLGPNDTFYFYGQPYGHAFDKWTWPYIGRSWSW